MFNTTAFHATKIGDISALAGVSHGSFYTHFSSKHDAFLAVLDEVLGEGFVRTAIRRELGIKWDSRKIENMMLKYGFDRDGFSS